MASVASFGPTFRSVGIRSLQHLSVLVLQPPLELKPPYRGQIKPP
jgi:hypothetical protein